MKAGELKIFTKSGNEVELLSPVTDTSPQQWRVKRTKGISAGKEMICHARCLVTHKKFESGT